jgi:iron complex transport system ATP-binding protein
MLRATALRIEVAGRVLLEAGDVALMPGRLAALLGRNGSGKSSLLAVLAGLAQPAAGSVSLSGRPLHAMPRHERALALGILPQDQGDGYWGSTLDYVLMGAYPRTGGGADWVGRARALLAELELGAHAAQPATTLSSGERQRARIAQLLLQDPAVMLLDEPLAHLDLRHQGVVLGALRRRARAGRAVLAVLHEPALALAACDDGVLLYHSSSLVSGPAREVIQRRAIEDLYDCRLDDTGAPSLTPALR